MLRTCDVPRCCFNSFLTFSPFKEENEVSIPIKTIKEMCTFKSIILLRWLLYERKVKAYYLAYEMMSAPGMLHIQEAVLRSLTNSKNSAIQTPLAHIHLDRKDDCV